MSPTSCKGECLISVAGRKLYLHEESVNSKYSGTSELRWIQFVVVFMEVKAVTSSGIKMYLGCIPNANFTIVLVDKGP